MTAAAAVIENRVRELGGAPKVETLEDRAARQARELTFESERKAALMSDAGVQAFRREFAALASAVGAAVSRVNASQQVTRARK